MVDGVLVLAAGKSSRIAEVSGGQPKPLLDIAGKPVLIRNLEWLASQGVGAVWINLHYRPEAIRERVGDGRGLGLTVRYSEEPELLGTAGAWKRLEQEWRGTSLVVYGDNLLQFDLASFVTRHRAAGLIATAALFDPARHRNTGIAGGRVELDPAGRVAQFVEGAAVTRPGAQYVNAGAYLLEPSLASRLREGFLDFGRDVFPSLAASGQLAAHVLEDSGYCLGLDTPASFAVARELVDSAKVTLA